MDSRSRDCVTITKKQLEIVVALVIMGGIEQQSLRIERWLIEKGIAAR
jgi:hypothetical protein